MVIQQKELVDEIKIEWKKLWRERLDDRVRAEGIAVDDYSSLFIEKGTIIHATRDFKALNFKEILEQHEVENPERYVPTNPQTGGWKKFVKDNYNSHAHRQRSADFYVEMKAAKPQLKKSGRGWLHI